jgi:hypothetical protein
MTDPCKKGTSVKILRNVVKIKTGRKTKLTKKNICEVYTNIQEGKLLLPPLVLTPDRMYLLDKKSPFNSNDYEKLFDRSSSRVTLKKLAEKINIKKVDTLTKKQLTDTILKRLQFLNISEPVKLSKRSSVAAVKCSIAAKRPAAVQSTAVKRPAAVQSTAAKVVTIFKGPNVPEKPLVPEQAKVVLGNRNYDLLFDPKTKREDLLRIANKVGVENTENMTKKELIEATTKRVRFMSNRGLTPKNIKSGAKVPFFPKPPNRPPPTTTPAFLQQKSGPGAGGPPVGGPPGGTPNFLKGRTVVPGPPRPSNVKPNNVKPNNVKPNNAKPSTTNTGTGNNNVKPNNVKPSTTNSGTGNNNVRPNNGIGKNTLPPSVKPSTTNIGTGNNNVRPNAPPPKKSGKSFFNYFKGGKKKNTTATAPAKKGKSFFNYFKGGKKKNAAATVPAKKGKSFFNYFKGGKKKNVNVKPNIGIGKNTLPPNVNPPPINVKPNKIENNKINNMTEELINNAVNNEISNSVRQNRAKNKNNNNFNAAKELNKQLNNEAKRQNRAKPKNNNNFNAAKELNKQLNNEAKRQNRAKNKNNNNFNATKEFNKQMAIRNMTDELITNAVNEELNNEISNSKPNNNFNATKEFNKQMTVRNMTDELITNAVNEELNKEISNSRLNNATKNIIRSINKATTLKELRKIYLNGSLKLHPNTGGNKDAFNAFKKAHTKKQNLLEAGNTKSNAANGNGNGTKNNKVLAIANKPVKNKKIEVNSNQLTNEIINKLKTDISSDINKVKLNNNKPIYNNSSNSNSNNNNNKTTQNNPLFEPNMTNNPIFNNKKSESNELSKHINNLGLPNANKKKLMNLFNTTNQTLGAAKRNANTLSNTRKLQNKNSFNGGLRLGANNNNVSLPPSNNAVNVNNVKVNVKNFNSERNKLKNKITKELNMIPNNDGKFQERKGFTKGRIGLWARELRAAKSIGDLDAIENALNKKVELRRNIENKYTKAGLTKVEKMNHRRKVVKFMNNVNKRRNEIEMQVKNRNNNNNKNSVISNYNSNDNSNGAKKMKYKSRDNFIEAKKVELRNLAKKTDTNFGRNINRMETRRNVFKLRGRIKGAIRRDEALSRL